MASQQGVQGHSGPLRMQIPDGAFQTRLGKGLLRKRRQIVKATKRIEFRLIEKEWNKVIVQKIPGALGGLPRIGRASQGRGFAPACLTTGLDLDKDRILNRNLSIGDAEGLPQRHS